MNHKLRFFLLVLTGMFLTLSGCNDAYEVTTVINPDGSCERIITCTRDSRGLPDGAFPLPTDSSWDTSWTQEKKEGESHQYIFTARKRFPSLDSLNDECSRRRDSASFQITLDVHRRFRWFYTYFTYEEHYARFNPIVLVPPSAVMSEEELHRFMTELHPDSLLQKKWEMWNEKNQMEFVFSRLLAAVAERQDSILTPSLLESKKLALFDAWKNVGHQKGRESGKGIEDDLLHSMEGILGIEPTGHIATAMEAAFREWERANERAGRAAGSYKVSAILPGTILQTNAGTVEGNRVTWEFSQDQIATDDIRMSAESRVLNFWTFVVTAIIVIVIIASPLAARLAARRAGRARRV